MNAQIQSQGARGGVLAGTAVPGWSLAKAGRITLLPDGRTDGRTPLAGWLGWLAGVGDLRAWPGSVHVASRPLRFPRTPCPRTRVATGVPGDGKPPSHSGSKEAYGPCGWGGGNGEKGYPPGLAIPLARNPSDPAVVLIAALGEGDWSFPHDLGGSMGRVQLGVCLDACLGRGLRASQTGWSRDRVSVYPLVQPTQS